MASLEQLLVVQEHDTAADQLRHRRDTLPQRAELAGLRRSLDELDAQLTERREQRHAVARSQKQLEDEVALVEAKVADVHGRLYGGTITAPKELQALQDDEQSLRRHQGVLEDRVIEQMELAEPLDAEVEDLVSLRAATEAGIASGEQELAAVEAEIDARLREVEAERAELIGQIPPPLVEKYEQLRHDLGGIAIARLVGTNCGGCHLTLSAVELDRIRHQAPGDMEFCEECGRLLVH